MFLFLLFVLFTLPLQAVVVGSNTAVSRQALTIFPSADDDNEIRGFAAFEDGFTLENSATSCLYDAFFPVSDNVTLNGGTLNLSQDLILEDSAQLATVGMVDGNSHALLFTTTSPILLPSGNNLEFVGNYTESAAVNSVDWHYGGGYLVLGTADGNIRVLSFDGSTLTSEAFEAYSKPIYCVRWHPSDDYIAVGTDGFGANKHLQILDFNTTTSVLTRTDNVNTSQEVVAVAWDLTGNYLASGNMQSPSYIDIFSFSGGTLTSKVDISLTTGQSISQRALCWDSTGGYLVAGADSNGDELRVYSYDGNVTVALDASVSIGKVVTAVDWSQTSSYIVVGLQGDTNNIRLYEHDPVGSSLTEKTSGRIAESQTVNSVAWCADGDKIAVGLQLDGSDTEVRVYSFDSGSLSFSLDGELDVFDTVNDVRWSSDEAYIVAGDDNYEVNVYNSGESNEGDFTFKDVKITFNGDVQLKKKAIFQGECALCCSDNTFDLRTSGKIEIDSGASLLIHNTQLKSLAGTNMCCLDSLSTLSLCNDWLLLDADFSFTQGHIDIMYNVTVSNPYIFSYEADQVSTIGSNGIWYFDSGTTFSYNPAGGGTNLIAFADSSSILYLYETTLYASSTGWDLTKGKLVIEGECPLESDATVQANGITFGDGASASNDIALKILPESGFKLNSGYMVYKNVGG